MKISLGADHGGFELKNLIREYLAGQGHELVDHGTNAPDSVDYPDYALPVAEDVVNGRTERGILVCGTGIGMAMAANKVHGIRAANVSDEFETLMSREHNDANVLTLGGRVLTNEKALELVDLWVKAAFTGGRHATRVAKIMALEKL